MGSNSKTYFVFDSETGFILSGFTILVDDHSDGYNIFTRPYKYPEYHSKDENCDLDYIYKLAKREGLKNLKKENLKVGVTDKIQVEQEFVKNPNYNYRDRYKARGWWKLLEEVKTI